MSRIKKGYVFFSLVTATVLLACTLWFFQKTTAYATEYTQGYDVESNDAIGVVGNTEYAPSSIGSEGPDGEEGDTGNTGFSLTFDGESGNFTATLRMLIVLTVLALAPSILIMLTSFTRCVIVLHFTRAAIGTNTAPPNQVLVGLALFLTLFIMNPTFTEVKEKAIDPFDQ